MAARNSKGGGRHPSSQWIWPHWLERQLDPSSPAFVPAGHDGPDEGPPWTNVTGRNWTTVGTLGGPGRVMVDRRGLICPVGAAWSLDWWLGAEDRWHVPSREVAVRQRLIDDAPGVETVLRVPGGDAVSRVYATAGGTGGDTFVVEVEADCAIPFALAWALRPATLDGVGRIDSIEVDGPVVAVDGRPVLWLPGPPGRTVLSSHAGGDAADTVFAGGAGATSHGAVHCPEGLATGVFVLPVAHRATVTARLIVPPEVPSGRSRRRAPPAEIAPAAAPGASAVARGWRAQSDRTVRLDLPPGPLASAIEAQRRYLPLLVATVGNPEPIAARLVVACAEVGFEAEAASVLDRWFVDDVPTPERSAHGAAAALWALGELVALGVTVVGPRWLPSVAGQAERLGRAPEDGPNLAVWRRAGLRAAAMVLSQAGEADAAGRITGWIVRSGHLLVPLAAGPPPSAPGPIRVNGIDARTEAILAAAGPLALIDRATPVAIEARDRCRRALVGGLVALGEPPRGLSPALTLALATVEGAGEDGASASGLVDRVLEMGGPTWTWPDLVLPGTGGGGAGPGHSPGGVAELWAMARTMLVDDRAAPDVIGLWPWWPPAWGGAAIEVHGLPTRAGVVSYAVRRHGRRPALLWDVTGTHGPVTVTAPGLDPHWSSVDARGEALFDPLALPDVEIS